MLYTVGSKAAYAPNVGKPEFKKLGRCMRKGQVYAGGIVFMTKDAALSHLAKHNATHTHGVYGLDTDYTNIYTYSVDQTQRLLYDCPIIKAD